MSVPRTCHACGGSGRRGIFECGVCGGQGKITGPLRAHVEGRGDLHLPGPSRSPGAKRKPTIRTRRRRRIPDPPS